MGRIDLNLLQLNDHIGGSRTSNVYAYASEDLNSKSVLKCIHTRNSTESSHILEDIVSSSSNLKCIVPIEGYDILKDNLDGWRLFIKMPRMRNNMKDIMNEFHNVKRQVPFEMVIELFYQLASTLEFLERKNIIHRNIKPTNILFDDAGKLYLSDISASRFKKDKESLGVFANMKDALLYMAPEIFARGGLESPAEQLKADVWSLGMIIVNLCIDNVKPMPLHLTLQDVEDQVDGYLDKIEEMYGKNGGKLAYILAGILDIDIAQRKAFTDVRRVLEQEFLNIVRPVKEDPHYRLIFRTLDEADRDTKRPLTQWRKTRKSKETFIGKLFEKGKEVIDGTKSILNKLWIRRRPLSILLLVILILVYFLKRSNEKEPILDNVGKDSSANLRADNESRITENMVITIRDRNYKVSMAESATFVQEEVERELEKIIKDIDTEELWGQYLFYMIRCTMFQNVSGQKEVQWYMGHNSDMIKELGFDSTLGKCSRDSVSSLGELTQDMKDDFAKLKG